MEFVRMQVSLSKSLQIWLGVILVGFIIGCAPKPVLKPNIVFPPPPEKPRLQFLYSISSREDVLQGKKLSVKDKLVGKEVRERLQKPYGVAVTSKGTILVADAGNRCVLAFNPDATKREDALRYIGTGAQGNLIEPINVAVDAQDNIFVTDVKQKLVHQYDANFKFVKTFGTSTPFENPGGIAVNPVTKELIVVDTKAHHVKCFSEQGELLRTFGQRGMGDGEFNFPSNVLCDGSGKIYVVDAMNFRIQIFDSGGKFLSKFGQADNVPGSFTRPRGIAMDSENHLYISDGAFDNVQVFTTDGTLLLYFGSAGAEPGQFQLPAGLAFDQQDRLYISDQYNKRIQVYQYVRYGK